jgi:hypothetical protein
MDNVHLSLDRKSNKKEKKRNGELLPVDFLWHHYLVYWGLLDIMNQEQGSTI